MAQVHQTNPKQVKNWLENNEAIVIDVREPAEFKSGHIQGAINKPLSTVCLEEVCMPEHTNKKLVLQCQGGKRSMMAVEKLLQENPQMDIYNLEGGINAWAEAGFQTQQTGRKVLPLNQQVQLAAGSLIVTGIMLGWFVHIGFVGIALFVGCGLMFAGLTGFCGMMKLLAKMPWNK